MKALIKKYSGFDKAGAYMRQEFEKIKLLSAQPMVNFIKGLSEPIKDYTQVEFSAFSQWGDDGIIQYLVNKLPIKSKTFIEFGVGNYLEANTRFLLMNNNWRGLIFDGSEPNMNFVKNDDISWKFNLTAKPLFVTKHNINQEIEKEKAGFAGELGILHIDIDGNDYWIWESLTVVNPAIVIMEYNSVFGNNAAITVPYADDFFVTNAHYSNLYFGASLKAFNHLAQQKGYTLVCSNLAGNNAYFVRNDLAHLIHTQTTEEAYVKCNFRQNRNSNGQLTFKADTEMITICSHLPVVNVETNETHALKNYL